MRAYLDPRVDDSKQAFTYGRPDIELLRTFCWEKFGWPRDKSEQLLLPVLKVPTSPALHFLVSHNSCVVPDMHSGADRSTPFDPFHSRCHLSGIREHVLHLACKNMISYVSQNRN